MGRVDMSDGAYRPFISWRWILLWIGVIALLWVAWKPLKILFFAPLPIVDWVEGETEIVSPTHPVRLVKVGRWEQTQARVLQNVRVVDSVLPANVPRAVISPLDIFVARGRMADDDVFQNLKVGYYWRVAYLDYKGPRQGAAWDEYVTVVSQNYGMFGDTQSPNGFDHEHVIPANNAIFHRLKDLRRGDWFRAKGWIVDIYDGDPIKTPGRSGELKLQTSRVHNDSGCEYFYITELE